MRNMPVEVDMPKQQPSPIGRELSIDIGKFKDMKSYKVGDKIKVEIEATIVGQHMHNVGKSKEHMMDIKITSFECDSDDEEEEDAAE